MAVANDGGRALLLLTLASAARAGAGASAQSAQRVLRLAASVPCDCVVSGVCMRSCILAAAAAAAA